MTTRHVSIIGAALSANKGAAAMVETVVVRLPDYIGETQFTLLSTYPEEDATRNTHPHLTVVGLEPLRLALLEIPTAVLAFLARKCRLPLGWVRTRASRSLLNSDVCVDVAGISFSDGRGIPILVYNTLMTGLPLLLGVPTVKAAQAMGPFSSTVNRTLARLVLAKLTAICARGARTRTHLDSLKLDNVVNVSDLAFSLPEAAELPFEIQQQISSVGDGFVLVMPSSVVKGIYERSGASYVGAMAELIHRIRSSTGRAVVIAPHSYRVGHGEGRMNDGPVCREVAQACADDGLVVAIDADLTAGELRRLVALSLVLVTSRFHAMISGLATSTPTVVVGWSHKYKEVLDDFGLTEFGCDSSELSEPAKLMAKIEDALSRRDEIAEQIARCLPTVQEQSERNFSVIAEAVTL